MEQFNQTAPEDYSGPLFESADRRSGRDNGAHQRRSRRHSPGSDRFDVGGRGAGCLYSAREPAQAS